MLCAPDQFPVREYLPSSEQMNLSAAFVELRGALGLIDCDPSKRDSLARLLDQSLAAYQAGDPVRGSHLLQDFQDLIFGRQD